MTNRPLDDGVIVEQEVSCIEYEVYNQDYVRSTIDCQPGTCST